MIKSSTFAAVRTPHKPNPSSAAPIDPRLDLIRQAERAFSAASERGTFHQKQRFFSLLTDDERARLPRLFADLTRYPVDAEAPADLRGAWDARARAFLGRLLDFAQLRQEHGLEVVSFIDPDDPRGVAFLSQNGSVVVAGAPHGGQRRFLYESIRAHEASGLREHGAFTHRARTNRPLRIGPLRLSRIWHMARGQISVDLDRPALHRIRARQLGASVIRPDNSPAQAADRTGRTHLDYMIQLNALAEVPGRADPCPVEECEILGEALHLQQSAGRFEEGLSLDHVDRFWTTNGTRYEVIPRGDVVGAFDLARKPRNGEQMFLLDVQIEPQRIVVGAPLALFSQSPGGTECTSFSGVVTEVAPTGGGGGKSWSAA